jgi:hypothetical protein
MNRRGFLRALVGAAAAPVIAKLATPFAGPELSDEIEWREDADGVWTVIDLRKRAMHELAKWWAEQFDKILFDAITNGAGVYVTMSDGESPAIRGENLTQVFDV